jgi:quercetin dioxygenase-like cupin family protein
MRLNLTTRDITVALVAAGATLAVSAATAQQPAVMHSSAFELSAVTPREVAYGSVRQLTRSPTATLAELEMHVTTLNAGQTSHAPHQHPNEELIIIKEGTVEALVHGEWKKLGVGAVIFQASNELHGIKNIGSGPATYHVINWKSK